MSTNLAQVLLRITPQQRRELKRVAKRNNVSEAATLRLALSRFLAAERRRYRANGKSS